MLNSVTQEPVQLQAGDLVHFIVNRLEGTEIHISREQEGPQNLPLLWGSGQETLRMEAPLVREDCRRIATMLGNIEGLSHRDLPPTRILDLSIHSFQFCTS